MAWVPRSPVAPIVLRTRMILISERSRSFGALHDRARPAHDFENSIEENPHDDDDPGLASRRRCRRAGAADADRGLARNAAWRPGRRAIDRRRRELRSGRGLRADDGAVLQ